MPPKVKDHTTATGINDHTSYYFQHSSSAIYNHQQRIQSHTYNSCNMKYTATIKVENQDLSVAQYVKMEPIEKLNNDGVEDTLP